MQRLESITEPILRLYCILPQEWGEAVVVGEYLIKIDPNDGHVDVRKDIARKLLQNPQKWSEKVIENPERFRRENQPVVTDRRKFLLKDPRTGRLLDDDEAMKMLSKTAAPTAAPDPLDALSTQLRAVPSDNVEVSSQLVDSDTAKQIAEAEESAQKAQTKKQAASKAADAEWPEVAADDPKDVLMATLKRLHDAKIPGVSIDLKKSRSKVEIFNQIKDAYDTLAKNAA